MPSLGFSVFKEKVLDGSKRQTIRKLRKHPIKIGDKLFLFWKMRTKQCERLGEGTCAETFFIKVLLLENFLDSAKPAYRIDRYETPESFGFRQLTESECGDLAMRDGFSNPVEMLRCLNQKHGNLYDIIFQVIRW